MAYNKEVNDRYLAKKRLDAAYLERKRFNAREWYRRRVGFQEEDTATVDRLIALAFKRIDARLCGQHLGSQ